MTPTITPTPTPTFAAAAGDANCDGEINAADLPLLVTLIETGDPAPCGGADADGNGVIDENDLTLTIDALFDTTPTR